MARKTECIAMLLAGGQGSRLGILTKNMAKPAVPYGGKYRIIDFPLSNCVNSGIYTVGVLTQYQPLELNDYIGNGQPWDLDRENGGVHILSPYQQIEGTEWYKNTANAIYQNINFIDRYSPEYVLILSGDHIYKMDYSKMLAYHKEKNADCTIASLEVPWEEASRFGLMFVNDDGSISEFEEKPKHPRSNKASMGVYIFTWSKLRRYLLEDEANPASGNDFGHDLIPAMHEAGERLFAYQFDGYWKDVGTIDSLWQANMDLLDPEQPLNISDNSFKIYARNYAQPPSFISDGAKIINSMVAEGCTVRGAVRHSIVSTGCVIEEGAAVSDCVLMPGTHIGRGAKISYTITGTNVSVGDGSTIGGSPENFKKSEWGIAVLGKDKVLPAGSTVKPREIV